ncbi:putative phosphatase [Thermanaerovibrio velox DSM 12556]|uniref:Putative phosphatase n=1 Tax=Thermanaerovibrio velox DSM 12556 TaxID=926567 RepID=H0UPX7_9BACT|nr:HAD family hydrolase [Thermanaerovibrio velox]EHM10686.1 putative phosphatase [Thermanaerovibrio velox DSM 12556]
MVDGIIFDVDGTLVDVKDSYPRVIRRAVSWGWEALGGVVDCEAYTEEHERVTKGHRAFNDDYDIPWAMLCMASRRGVGSLKEAFPTPEEWKNELTLFDGDDPVEWVLERFGEPDPGFQFREAVRSFCDRLYVEGIDCEPYYTYERPLIKRSFKDIPLPVGIYTGRPWRELDLALKLLGWEDFPRDLVVPLDSGIVKPSPLGLEVLCERLGISNPAFFGDAESDRAALEAFGRGMFIAVGDWAQGAHRRFASVEEGLDWVLGGGVS